MRHIASAVLVLFLAGACRASVQVAEPYPQPVPTAAPGEACNLFPTYGLTELRCELRPPAPPGDTYMAEDTCRRLVSCERFEETCELIAPPAFDECKACFAACTDPACVNACSATARSYDTGG